MPIKTENMARYPGGSTTSREWLEIRQEVLERAGHKCEQCGVPDRTTVLRVKAPGFEHWIDPASGHAHDADTGEFLGAVRGSEMPFGKFCRIVLTIAHLDHDPTNNGMPGNRSNVKALCQRHHLAWDAKHHAEQRNRTLQAKRDAARVRELGSPLPGLLY